MTARKKPGPKKVAAMKARLLADPNTAQIAQSVGLTLDAYVKQVMHFIENPNAEPELYIAEDEDLRAQGHVPPSESEMLAYLEQARQMLDAKEGSGFADKKAKKVELDSGARQLDEEHSDPRLKSLLDHELRGKRGGKT